MYFAGIDIGSSSIKIVILSEDLSLVGKDVSPSGSLYHKNGLERFGQLKKSLGLSDEDLCKSVVTGYGRRLFEWADKSINEITANALGASYINKNETNPITVINIGGQDSKVINVSRDGVVEDFVMNDKCAAGTGRFLEMSARILEIGVDELANYHFLSDGDYVEISNMCAVFAESEIISLLTSGESKEMIIAGIHYSIAKRIYRMARRINIHDSLLLDGGAGLNKGLQNALQEEFMQDLQISAYDPQFTVAIGAAMEASRMESQ